MLTFDVRVPQTPTVVPHPFVVLIDHLVNAFVTHPRLSFIFEPSSDLFRTVILLKPDFDLLNTLTTDTLKGSLGCLPSLLHLHLSCIGEIDAITALIASEFTRYRAV
jgi:hypothetical protein